MASHETGQQMGERKVQSSSSGGVLYFVVGALVVAVAGLGYMYFNGQMRPQTPGEKAGDALAGDAAAGDAARDLGGVAKNAARNLNPPTTPAPKPVQPVLPTTLPPS